MEKIIIKKQSNNPIMKSRTNYKTPVFFGWYTINYENKRGHNQALKPNDHSNKDLDYFHRR